MRRNPFLCLVFTSLCLWAAATYYLFLHRPISRVDEANRVENHLDALEERLRFQFAENERLLSDLKQLVEKQQVSQSGIISDKAEIPDNEGNGDTEVAGEAPAAQGEVEQKIVANGQNELIDPEHRTEEQLVVEGGQQHSKPANSSASQLSPQDLQVEKLRSLAAKGAESESAVAILVLACNRVTVRKCLDQLLAYRPSADHFPIIVSQDCVHTATTEALTAYGSRIFLIQQPDQSEIDVPPKEKKFRGYFNIARHYGWALNQTFFHFNFQTAIIVEDDLDVAPDFFEYFRATLPILRRDPTLWCVSAWNDNGKAALVDEGAADLLYRTDFFPGLGWMLTQEIWSELSRKWPASYWDDWVRQPEQRQGRACIRPELSRTRTFGKVGVSNGHFFDKHLKYIKLNEKFVPFTKLDLSYLLKDNYDVEFVRRVYDSPVVTYQELRSGSIVASGSVRIPYYTKDAFKLTAKMLGLMDDFRSGVPRTGYRGVVSFMYKGRRVYLAPNANWKNYDPSWS